MPSRDSDGPSRFAVVLAVLLLGLAATAPVFAQETGTGTATSAGTETASDASVLVVDDDGGADYRTISAAVAAAQPETTVRVLKGNYTEAVVINRSITLVAPDGALLYGGGDGVTTGITITEGAAPTIRGFTLVDYRIGVDARRSSGAWSVQDVAIEGADNVGVYAAASTGDWSVSQLTVANTTGVAVGAFKSSGNWSVTRATIRNTRGVGINARFASGNWRVRNADVRNTTAGTTIPANWSGTAIYAGNASGNWTVGASVFGNNDDPVIDATNADPAGNATGNYWSGGVPTEGDCIGAVDCGDPLSTPPVDFGDNTPAYQPEAPGGNGLPLVQVAAGIVGLLVLLGGGYLVTQTLGADALVATLEGVVGSLLAAVGVLDGGGGNRIIALSNEDQASVTCRVQCRTNDGVQFQYDLTLASGEQREAPELPASGPFEITVQVGDVDVTETFESATDVIVRVVSNDAEVVAA